MTSLDHEDRLRTIEFTPETSQIALIPPRQADAFAHEDTIVRASQSSSGESVSQTFRLALITAGQAPRPQIVADLAAALPASVEIVEFGALDGMSYSDIEALKPGRNETTFLTRLEDGRRVFVPQTRVHAGMQKVLSGISAAQFHLATIFCTGSFSAFPAFVSPCRLIRSQPAVDNAVSMLVRAGHKIGVIQPFPGSFDEDVLGLAPYQRQVTWLVTSDEEDWTRVVAECSDCEALVLNSIDYDEETAVRLGTETGVPVILPRRVLASAIRLVLDVDQLPNPALLKRSATIPLLDRLTKRERQVMWLMVEGLQSKQIGRQLDISPHTVSIHRASVLSKLQAPNTNTLTRLMLGGPLGEQAT